MFFGVAKATSRNKVDAENNVSRLAKLGNFGKICALRVFLETFFLVLPDFMLSINNKPDCARALLPVITLARIYHLNNSITMLNQKTTTYLEILLLHEFYQQTTP